VGAVFHIPHGRAVGIALPYSLEYISSNPPLPNAPDPVERLDTAARFVGINANSDQERIQKFIQKIRDLEREIGEPLSLKEAGITEKQMKEVSPVRIPTCIPLHASAKRKILDSFFRICGREASSFEL